MMNPDNIIQTPVDTSTFDLRKINTDLLALMCGVYRWVDGRERAKHIVDTLIHNQTVVDEAKRKNCLTKKELLGCYQNMAHLIDLAIEGLVTNKGDTVYKFLWVIDEYLETYPDKIKKTYLHPEFCATKEEVLELLGSGNFRVTKSPIKIER